MLRFNAMIVALIASQTVMAEADGPDYYQVTGVAHDDALNVRVQPDPSAEKLGTIPPDGLCVRNLGCRGGLSYQEFTELTPEAREQRLKENPRWCKVEYQGTTGWVAGRYLRESACTR